MPLGHGAVMAKPAAAGTVTPSLRYAAVSAVGATVGAVTSHTLADPGAMSANDVFLVAINIRRDRTVTANTADATGAAGWAVVGPTAAGSVDGTGNQTYIFWTRDTTPDRLFNFSTSTSGWNMIGVVIKDVIPTTGSPFAGGPTAATAGTDLTLESPAVASLPNSACLGIVAGGWSDTGGAGTTPTGWAAAPDSYTMVTAFDTTDPHSYGMMLAHKPLSSTTMDSSTFTMNGTAPNNWTGYAMALSAS